MEKKLIKLLPVVAVIILAVVLRFMPHPPNFSPIAAMALFGGVYLGRRYAIVLPFLAMAVSDVFLGFNQSTPLVYLSFLLTGLIGFAVRKHKNAAMVIGASLLSSLIFFLVTNFNYYYTPAFYPKTIAGMLESYQMAIPFFKNTILGDLFYTSVFFGGFELASRLLERKVYGRTNLHT